MSFGSTSSTTNQSSQNQNNGSTSGSVQRTLLPGQSASESDIFSVLHGYMTNPQQAVNPARMAARDQVSQNYSGLADQVRQQFLTTGGGASGKSGQAQLQGELGRAGALSQVDQSAAQQAAALPLTAAQLAEQFLGINLGQTSSGTSSDTGSSSGTATTKSSNFGINLGSILGGLATGGMSTAIGGVSSALNSLNSGPIPEYPQG